MFCPLSTDRAAEPVAESGKHHDVDPEHQPPQERQLAREFFPFRRGLRAVKLAQPVLDHRDDHPVVDHPDDDTDKRADESRERILHLPSPAYLGASLVNCSTAATIATMASESGRNTFQPSRISWS